MVAPPSQSGQINLKAFPQSTGRKRASGRVRPRCTLQNGTLTGAVTSTGGTVNTIGGSASLTTTAGTTTLTGSNTYTGASTVSGGTLLGGAPNTFSAASATTINAGGTVDLGGFAQTINAVMLAGGTLQNGTLTGAVTSTGGTVNTIGGSASLTTTAGITTLTGRNTYTGATTVGGGTLQAGATNAFSPASEITVASRATLALNSFDQTIASLEGAGNVTLGSAELTVGGDNASTTFSGTISGSGGSLIKTGSGVLTLSGINSYTGPTDVNAGALFVDGSIASSSLTTVSSGATLGGSGTVGSTTILAGGTFAPGPSTGTPGTITVAGNLAFQSGAQYMVFLNSSTSSFANVTGTASLNGTVNAVFAPGSSARSQYLILQSAGLGGTTFSGLTIANLNLPAGFIPSLSYTANDAFLNFTAALGAGTTLNVNQQNVANAINSFFNSGGTLPLGFVNVFNLTGGNLANALTQLSGENATGAERSSFQLMNGFLNVMLDPHLPSPAIPGMSMTRFVGSCEPSVLRPSSRPVSRRISRSPTARCSRRRQSQFKPSSNAGRLGARPSEAARRRTAIRSSAHTT